MKHILALMFCLIGGTIFCQSGQNIDQHVEKVVKLYDMTSTQASQYKALAIEKQDAIKKLNINSSTKAKTGESMQLLKNIDLKFDKKVISILDERQKKVFEIQKKIAETIMERKGVKSPK